MPALHHYTHLSVAIPAMAELEQLPRLLQCLRRQTTQNFTTYICINNPEQRTTPAEEQVYAENQASIALLENIKDLGINIIDRSSQGLGWQGKKKGVGWARKELFARILEEETDDELIVSLDADTDFADNYLEQLLDTFNQHPDCCALAVPYYHPLTGDEANDRAMLRYECYMRHYLIQMLQIESPYAFTALGSAIVFPLWAYRRVGGITPLQGGEDFYLLQKFAKTGKLLNILDDTSTHVCPSGRISHRVPFGTGPAVALSLDEQEERYPFYPESGFGDVKATCDLFPTLYDHDIETPMSAFLREQLATDDLWGPLRKNFRTRELFVHACRERVDGLRILQYLKTQLTNTALPSGYPDFKTTPIADLNAFRDALYQKEMVLRQK